MAEWDLRLKKSVQGPSMYKGKMEVVLSDMRERHLRDQEDPSMTQNQ